MSIFDFLRSKKEKASLDSEDPLIGKNRQEVNQNSRFKVSTTYNDKNVPVCQVTDMFYASGALKCRLIRSQQELSGTTPAGKAFNAQMFVAPDGLDAAYGTIEKYDRSGVIQSRLEKKFDYSRFVNIDKYGQETVVYDTRQTNTRKIARARKAQPTLRTLQKVYE